MVFGATDWLGIELATTGAWFCEPSIVTVNVSLTLRLPSLASTVMFQLPYAGAVPLKVRVPALKLIHGEIERFDRLATLFSETADA